MHLEELAWTLEPDHFYPIIFGSGGWDKTKHKESFWLKRVFVSYYWYGCMYGLQYTARGTARGT